MQSSRVKHILGGLLMLVSMLSYGQTNEEVGGVEIDYENPKEYVIGGVSVRGTVTLDANLLAHISGLALNEKIQIPGDKIGRAIERIWRQQVYSDVELKITGVSNDTIYLMILVQERAKLSKYSIRGLSKTETKNVRDEISLRRGQIITENLIGRTKKEIESYYYEKGFYNAKADITATEDTSIFNSQMLRINIKKGRRVKVQEVIVRGNDSVKSKRIRQVVKPKQKKGKINPFASSKLVKSEYDMEKKNIVTLYQALGYRDAQLVTDSIIRISPNRVKVILNVDEGNKYYFRNIVWSGNTKYSSGKLDTILGIKKGDVFNQAKLESQLFMNQASLDVSSRYMDDGYLFFNISPVETNVENDSIDLEIRIYEGKQATINAVTVTGNDKTSDFVILRALRTKPGQKFSRTDIQRSLRELAALNYFDPEKLDVNPIPNPANGTVDIEYKVVEKPSDQIEASGGFGGGFGFVGTIGLSLNNFSTRKMLKGDFSPIPTGDGQRLTLRAQSNGLPFQSYNFSFTEPWLGGKKPNSLTASVFYSRQTSQANFTVKNDPNRQRLHTTGASLVYGKLLKWPDDFFTWTHSLNYQKYTLENWRAFGSEEIGYTDGVSNSLSYNTVLSRNSTSAPIYPMSGSQFSLSIQATLPHSLLSGTTDFNEVPAQEKYRWVEYHKWKFNASWFMETAKRLVLVPHFETGIIGLYNKDVGYSPFEQFRVGGSGFGSWAVYGTEIIPQKGYGEGEISADIGQQGDDADPLYAKYSIEMRYPLSLNPSATVYGYTYFEAGNTWNSVREYNPFELKRAVGVGVRMYLPMFGLLGFDYGWGMDKPGARLRDKGQFLFSIGQSF